MIIRTYIPEVLGSAYGIVEIEQEAMGDEVEKTGNVDLNLPTPKGKEKKNGKA